MTQSEMQNKTLEYWTTLMVLEDYSDEEMVTYVRWVTSLNMSDLRTEYNLQKGRVMKR